MRMTPHQAIAFANHIGMVMSLASKQMVSDLLSQSLGIPIEYLEYNLVGKLPQSR